MSSSFLSPSICRPNLTVWPTECQALKWCGRTASEHQPLQIDPTRSPLPSPCLDSSCPASSRLACTVLFPGVSAMRASCVPHACLKHLQQRSAGFTVQGPGSRVLFEITGAMDEPAGAWNLIRREEGRSCGDVNLLKGNSSVIARGYRTGIVGNCATQGWQLDVGMETGARRF